MTAFLIIIMILVALAILSMLAWAIRTQGRDHIRAFFARRRSSRRGGQPSPETFRNDPWPGRRVEEDPPGAVRPADTEP